MASDWRRTSNILLAPAASRRGLATLSHLLHGGRAHRRTARDRTRAARHGPPRVLSSLLLRPGVRRRSGAFRCASGEADGRAPARQLGLGARPKMALLGDAEGAFGFRRFRPQHLELIVFGSGRRPQNRAAVHRHAEWPLIRDTGRQPLGGLG